jgi:hypothetical protein
MNEHPPVVVVSEERQRFRRKIRKVSAMVVLIVIAAHLLVGLVAAIYIVARGLVPPDHGFVQRPVEIKPVPPPHALPTDHPDSRTQAALNNRLQSPKPATLMMPSLPPAPVDIDIPVQVDPGQIHYLPTTGPNDKNNGTGTGNPFGQPGQLASGLLEGTFYDLKQLKNGTPTNIDNPGWDAEVQHFLRNGPSMLQKYFRAPKNIYTAKMAIPAIAADGAPEAFSVQDTVQPRHWLAVYNGRVTAPETGRYRFIGAADDVMLVYVRHKLVFDSRAGKVSEFGGREGIEFTAQQNNACDIQIVIGENPGGIFMAWLQIQKDGGQPYWFRVSNEKVNFKSTGKENPVQQPQPKMLEQGPPWLPARKSVN